MSKRKLVDPLFHERSKFLFGGLVGFDAILIVQLAAVDTLDRPLMFAVGCLAVALPLLLLRLGRVLIEGQGQYTLPSSPMIIAVESVALVCNIVGIAALFFHFCVLIGVLFLASTAVTLILMLPLLRKLAAVNQR